MTFYGIRNKKTHKTCGFSSVSNENAEDCVDITFNLELNSKDNVWLVPEKAMAEQTIKYNTEWYNAGYTSPSRDKNFTPDDYEVFEINI